MILAIADKCTPSLPLSRLRGRESRVARPVGAFFFREEGK
jgi:hypothetical protein